MCDSHQLQTSVSAAWKWINRHIISHKPSHERCVNSHQTQTYIHSHWSPHHWSQRCLYKGKGRKSLIDLGGEHTHVGDKLVRSLAEGVCKVNCVKHVNCRQRTAFMDFMTRALGKQTTAWLIQPVNKKVKTNKWTWHITQYSVNELVASKHCVGLCWIQVFIMVTPKTTLYPRSVQ